MSFAGEDGTVDVNQFALYVAELMGEPVDMSDPDTAAEI